MIPTIFYNRECQKCRAYGTIVRSTLELVEKNTGNIQITSRCPDNTNCTKEHKSILQAEQIEYFLYAAFYYLKEKSFIDSVINFDIAHECLLRMGTEILISNTINKEQDRAERIVGAFIALYMKVCKATDKDIESLNNTLEAIKTLRNKCVHKGLLPREKDTIEHGKKVYENIVQIFSNIRKTVEYKTWLCNNLSKKGGASITIFNEKVFFIDAENHSSFDKAYKSFLEHYQDIGTTVKIKYETAITPVQADLLTKEQLKELL